MISVVIPAHNEEAYLANTLRSVQAAASKIEQVVEIIVVINRCTDNTQAIAESFGTIIVEELEANVAKVRNRGLYQAQGDILITLDADTTMSENFLVKVEQKIRSGKYSAGAALMITDHLTMASVLLGIVLVFPALCLMRFSGGMFWMSRDAFELSKGFDSQYLTGEDFHFWITLRALARKQHKRFGFIMGAYLITSDRKINEFGPWFMLTHPHWFYYAIKGNNQAFADRYLYHTSRSNDNKKQPPIDKK